MSVCAPGVAVELGTALDLEWRAGPSTGRPTSVAARRQPPRRLRSHREDHPPAARSRQGENSHICSGQLLTHSRAVPVTTPSELLHRVGRGASTRRRGGTHDPRWHRRPDPHHHLAHHHLLSDLDRAPARTRPGASSRHRGSPPVHRDRAGCGHERQHPGPSELPALRRHRYESRRRGPPSLCAWMCAISP